MLDEQTISRLSAKFCRAMEALLNALDDEPTQEHGALMGIGISRHLLHGELGREPTFAERDAVMAAVQELLHSE